MKTTQRRQLALAALAALTGIAAVAPASAQAPAYPGRTITLVVPTAPGGTTDISARMLAEPLGKALGQSVIVDNKGGGNGTIAAMAVKRAEPDGYTLLMQYSGYHVITPAVSKQPPGWEAKDLQPVANVLAAIDAGADRFDASLGGIGGCPYAPGATGNVCSEEIVHALQLMGYDTGVDLALLIEASKRLPALIGHDTPSQIVKAGRRLDLHHVPADFDAIRERALARHP